MPIFLRPLLVAVALLAACEGEATLPTDTLGDTGQLTINASSASDFRYFNLASGTEVAVTDPRTSSAWDLALRRYEVRLNGGVAGTKGVTGVRVVDNSELPAATLLGFTPENQLAAFEGVTASNIPAAGSFTSTGLAPTTNAWFRASGPTTLVAVPTAAWKVRRADGNYALLRVAELTLSGFTLASLRLEVRLQEGTTGALGAVQSFTVPAGAPATPTRVSLATGSVVTTSGCSWDLEVTSAITLTVNPDATCPTGTFPLESGESFTTIATAADAPSYGRFLSALSSPIPNGFTADAKPPFLYGIDPVNTNRFTPTFNVYLIRVGSATYKVQFLSYYNPTGGESGFLTIRHARIQ